VKELDLSSDQADVGTTTTDKPDPVAVGQTLTYRMTVANHGPGEVTGLILTDTFPSGTRFVSVGASQGSCTVQIKQRFVTCDIGSLASGGSATVTVVVRLGRIGTITNSASASGTPTDPNPTNNSDSESTTVVP
jgi:uncharacterized repeat protein (TIGR01451 family)